MSIKGIFRKVKHQRRSVLTAEEGLDVLKHYRIPVVKMKLVRTAEEAVRFAEKIGYPVVLKILSKDITHKTDVNGVFLRLEDKDSVEHAFNSIMVNAKRKAPRAKVEGVLVQEMIDNCAEVIVGGKKDEQFGSCILFGLGGVFVEVLEDVSLRVCPITRKDAEMMVQEIKAYKVLKGYRGRKYDVNALIDILLKASRLLTDNPEIKELDINPVFALRKGAKVCDARIVI